jgi:hypothetical protein
MTTVRKQSKPIPLKYIVAAISITVSITAIIISFMDTNEPLSSSVKSSSVNYSIPDQLASAADRIAAAKSVAPAPAPAQTTKQYTNEELLSGCMDTVAMWSSVYNGSHPSDEERKETCRNLPLGLR